MKKWNLATDGDGHRWFLFWCPGCDDAHGVPIDGPRKWGSSNIGTDTPSLSPSLRINQDQCHLFLKNGMIQFLSDCKHVLAGQTVQAADWPY